MLSQMQMQQQASVTPRPVAFALRSLRQLHALFIWEVASGLS
jgi:hypothetical protein